MSSAYWLSTASEPSPPLTSPCGSSEKEPLMPPRSCACMLPSGAVMPDGETRRSPIWSVEALCCIGAADLAGDPSPLDGSGAVLNLLDPGAVEDGRVVTPF